MCGIAGIYLGEFVDELFIKKMLAQIRHRGPDDMGIHADHQILLGHNRLSIIDVEGGREPLYNETGQVCLVFNGEIYNYKELRKGLTHHQFQTQTDAEVIIHLYEDLGSGCVEHLDGMFAFALFDGEELLLARDPLGIKPLYHGTADGSICFASEIKALMQVCDDINEFSAGHYYHTEEGEVKYFDPESLEEARLSEYAGDHIPSIIEEDLKETIQLLRGQLGQAVQKRLMSDVPLGVFLSGGLDSSLIAALARPHFDTLHSFSVGMDSSLDRQYARKVAEHLCTEHHDLVYTFDDMIQALPDVIYHLESFEPSLVRTAIPTYFVSKLASDYVKVVLSGEGSDELFSGYHYLKQLRNVQSLNAELLRLVAGLHNVNLQRVDRMTMAHSIEGRVPFLDVDFVKMSLQIPPHLKLHGEEEVEKWILRKAFSDVLPHEVTWRTKQQFASGAGSAHLLAEYAEQQISDVDFYSERRPFPCLTLQSKEELLYYRIFREYYDAEQAAMAVGRWPGTEYAV
ncbi:MAG: asparagine synthase B [Bacteroidota bacterium]